MNTRGTILESEVVDGERITRVSQVDESGALRDLSVQTGDHTELTLRVEDHGHEIVLAQRARADHR